MARKEGHLKIRFRFDIPYEDSSVLACLRQVHRESKAASRQGKRCLERHVLDNTILRCRGSKRIQRRIALAIGMFGCIHGHHGNSQMLCVVCVCARLENKIAPKSLESENETSYKSDTKRPRIILCLHLLFKHF